MGSAGPKRPRLHPPPPPPSPPRSPPTGRSLILQYVLSCRVESPGGERTPTLKRGLKQIPCQALDDAGATDEEDAEEKRVVIAESGRAPYTLGFGNLTVRVSAQP